MSYSRERYNAGKRASWHDYRDRSIYHIVLNKNAGIPDFSVITGIPGDRQWAPKAVPSFLGRVIGEAISSLKHVYPFTSILRRCIMPDHVHMVLYVKEKTDVHLGELIKFIKNRCYDTLTADGLNREMQVFADNYHDTFLVFRGQLQRMLDYVSDNPRRHLVRQQYPSWFQRFVISDGKDSFEAYGNWDLMVEPVVTPVRAGREFRKNEIAYKQLWVRTVLNDGILVSPFINEMEKRVRDWAVDNGGALIYIVPDEFGERYKPSGVLFDLCAEGRLMLVSVPALPEYAGLPENLAFRKHCLRMNDVAAAIAAGTFAVSECE